MSFSTRRRVVLAIVVMAIAIFGYQNCSRVNFASTATVTATKTTGGAVTGGGQAQCRTVNSSEVSPAESLVPCSPSSTTMCALVCHVPEGNPAAKHNIIIGLPARSGSHQPGSHGGDYDGPCTPSVQVFEACTEG